jgi:hypothetical protein
MTANVESPNGYGPRAGIIRPGSDPNKYMNIGKINASTGEMKVIYSQPQGTNGSVLTTAGITPPAAMRLADILKAVDMYATRIAVGGMSSASYASAIGSVHTPAYGAHGRRAEVSMSVHGHLTVELLAQRDGRLEEAQPLHPGVLFRLVTGRPGYKLIVDL